MAKKPGDLTTTSYAILGLLAVRPWTTYELAQQMHRALGQFWPRAQSKIYEEPKKLVTLGLATASAGTVGKRPRTVYRITAKGRRALAAWVPTPGAPPALESEQLIKVFFAENGSKADLLDTIDSFRRWSADQSAMGAVISRGYLQGEGPFPERLPWLILSGRFLDEFNQAVARWAEWATGVVQDWPEDVKAAEPDWETLDAMASRNEEVARRARRAPAAGAASAGDQQITITVEPG